MADASTPQTPIDDTASQAQLDALAKLGIRHDFPLSKREASHLIENATRALDQERLDHDRERAQAEVAIKRAAFDTVKLNREIADSGLESEVELELARLRNFGREPNAKRQSGRGR